MDESGHDHKNASYEVRGGVVLHASTVWFFAREMVALEEDCFGDNLHRYHSEIKGAKLLEKRRIKWAQMIPDLDPLSRRENCLSFLKKGLENRSPSRIEFAAFGQACICMVDGIFNLLEKYNGKILACMVPAGVTKPESQLTERLLSKDKVFLLQRYYYLLSSQSQNGLLVMDETDEAQDRKFIRQMDSYFSRTDVGQMRSRWIVPSPFFVSSSMTSPIQAADICIYCINWTWRLEGMNQPKREDLDRVFGHRIKGLQWSGEIEDNGKIYSSYGIVHVPDPYIGRH